MESRSGIITLISDFGMRDAYVGAMKGVICTIRPSTRIIDISHEVPPQDIAEGAYLLEAAYPWFPPGTVHVVVVDPGVGTDRRGIAVYTNGHLFVGPDNGVLSPALTQARVFVRQISDVDYALPQKSDTFHGRDVFAPAAAHLASGISLERMGPEVEDYVVLDLPKPHVLKGRIEGQIVRIDRFGNGISNIPRSMVQRLGDGPYEIFLGDRSLGPLKRRYRDVAPGEPLALIGGDGRLEIATSGASAEDRLEIAPGTPVRVIPAG
ncbi:MAG: SAM-dependent chlorinase/fluorinase [Candidatus Eisenbacteria bacterium]